MSIKKARAALSHSVVTGVSRNHLDRLVRELAAPFHAARADTELAQPPPQSGCKRGWSPRTATCCHTSMSPEPQNRTSAARSSHGVERMWQNPNHIPTAQGPVVTVRRYAALVIEDNSRRCRQRPTAGVKPGR